MSDVFGDLYDVAGDTVDLLVDAAEGDYHAAAAGVDYVMGDSAGVTSQLAEVDAAEGRAEGDFDQAVTDLSSAFDDAGIDLAP
jgi:hypothetical protein